MENLGENLEKPVEQTGESGEKVSARVERPSGRTSRFMPAHKSTVWNFKAPLSSYVPTYLCSRPIAVVARRKPQRRRPVNLLRRSASHSSEARTIVARRGKRPMAISGCSRTATRNASRGSL